MIKSGRFQGLQNNDATAKASFSAIMYLTKSEKSCLQIIEQLGAYKLKVSLFSDMLKLQKQVGRLQEALVIIQEIFFTHFKRQTS